MVSVVIRFLLRLFFIFLSAFLTLGVVFVVLPLGVGPSLMSEDLVKRLVTDVRLVIDAVKIPHDTPGTSRFSPAPSFPGFISLIN